MNEEYREIPTPEFDYDVNNLVEMYEAAYEQIRRRLLRFVEEERDEQLILKEQRLLIQIRGILQQLNEQSRSAVIPFIMNQYLTGQAATLVSLGYAATQTAALSMLQFDVINIGMAQTMAADTFNDLLQMTQRTEQQVKNTVRKIVSETMKRHALENIGYKSSIRDISSKLLEEGFSKDLTDKENWRGVVDRAGRRWTVQNYVSMVVKTKGMQSHVEGVTQQTAARNVDLAIISAHGAEDACRPFENTIISLRGETEGFLSYQQIYDSNLCFHPNCKHNVSPLRKIELAPPDVKRAHAENAAQNMHDVHELLKRKGKM